MIFPRPIAVRRMDGFFVCLYREAYALGGIARFWR